jgi:hypothetical protein
MKKLVEASEQLAVLNEKLAVQRIAVVEKTAACEALLEEIAAGTQRAEEKKAMAVEKGKEIAEQSKDIETEKVSVVCCLTRAFRSMTCFGFQLSKRLERRLVEAPFCSCLCFSCGYHQKMVRSRADDNGIEEMHVCVCI